MHRTGSSLLTSVLNDLGFNPGSELLEADTYNQEGYWEFKPLLEFHERILSEFNNQWFAPGHQMPLEELLLHYQAEAESLIRIMDLEERDWCWKDPRLVLFLDFWLEILADRPVKWIITHRHPASIASSLESRNHFDIETGLKLWEYSMIQLISRKDRLTDSITIPYEEMLSDPKKQINRIAGFLQPQWDEETRLARCETASFRIKDYAVYDRDRSKIVLTEQQRLLEKMIRQEINSLDHPDHTWEAQTHPGFFRKMLRELSSVTTRQKIECESSLQAERQKVGELYQIISLLNEQLDKTKHQQQQSKGRLRGMISTAIRKFKYAKDRAS
jgi:hypothetical protein